MMLLVEYTGTDDDGRTYRIGSEPPEPFEGTIGQAYRQCLKLFGRCTGHVYLDRTRDPNNPTVIGWVFRKRVEYSDAHRIPRGKPTTYLRDTWVTLLKQPDTITRERHYLEVA